MKCNNFRKLFPDPSRKVFLPVIHLTDSETEIYEAGKAISDGDADGVCLICHTGSVQRVTKAYRAVRANYNIPIILNFLGQQDPLSILERLTNTPPDGLWTDEGTREPSSGQFNTLELDDFYQRARRLFPKMLLARSVAFKHQQEIYPSGLTTAVKTAVPYMDILVTSGPATGQPPNPEKIQQMSAAADGHPLAIASGITYQNLSAFKPNTDCFMVNSGLCEESNMLSSRLLKEFAARLRRD